MPLPGGHDKFWPMPAVVEELNATPASIPLRFHNTIEVGHGFETRRVDYSRNPLVETSDSMSMAQSSMARFLRKPPDSRANKLPGVRTRLSPEVVR
jgi:hypothetical protein